MEALRTKVSSLESALASSTTATSQLQDQLAESKGQQEGELRHLREERDNFIAQVRGSSILPRVCGRNVLSHLRGRAIDCEGLGGMATKARTLLVFCITGATAGAQQE